MDESEGEWDKDAAHQNQLKTNWVHKADQIGLWCLQLTDRALSMWFETHSTDFLFFIFNFDVEMENNRDDYFWDERKMLKNQTELEINKFNE